MAFSKKPIVVIRFVQYNMPTYKNTHDTQIEKIVTRNNYNNYYYCYNNNNHYHVPKKRTSLNVMKDSIDQYNDTSCYLR